LPGIAVPDRRVLASSDDQGRRPERNGQCIHVK
jgi:hypothetical protein